MTALRAISIAVAALLAGSVAASAQQRQGGFNYDKCFSRCMGWNDPYHCSKGCSKKQGEVQWQQKLQSEKIGRNNPNHPQSPHFHSPAPYYGGH